VCRSQSPPPHAPPPSPALPASPPPPPHECALTRNGVDYRGSRSVTDGNHTCLVWTLPPLTGPDDRLYQRWASLLRPAANFCRNPDNDLAPWCVCFAGLHKSIAQRIYPKSSPAQFLYVQSGIGFKSPLFKPSLKALYPLNRLMAGTEVHCSQGS
jgi:hypothetical protein